MACVHVEQMCAVVFLIYCGWKCSIKLASTICLCSLFLECNVNFIIKPKVWFLLLHCFN